MFGGLNMAQLVFRARHIGLRTKNQAGVSPSQARKPQNLVALRPGYQELSICCGGVSFQQSFNTSSEGFSVMHSAFSASHFSIWRAALMERA